MTDSEQDLFVEQMETFIFMDFETTGLIRSDDNRDPLLGRPVPGAKNRNSDLQLRSLIKTTNNKDIPFITEMSFVSAPRSLILYGIDRMKERYELDSNRSMAVRLACNVHTRQVKPPFTEQQWRDYENERKNCPAIHLSRQDLEDKRSFADEWPGVLHLLQMSKKPACLVAHNGVKFDFRVLFGELARNKLATDDGSGIPDQVYYLDSYLGFIDLEKEYHQQCKSAVEMMNWTKISSAVVAPKQEPEEPTSSAQVAHANDNECREQTPPLDEQAAAPSMARLTRSEPPSAKRQLFANQPQLSPDNPLNFLRTTQWSPAKKRRLTTAKGLFVRKENNDWGFDEYASIKYFQQRGVFRLDEMFKQLMDQAHEAHFAQDDCDALLQVSIAYGREFVDYADSNSRPLPF